jgi:threonine/homoserine/homoserine lactone efflux protein
MTNFLTAFAFSFLGSIPPGTLNLTIVQLGLNNQMHVAMRFAFAAALIEYPYAWIAVKFERLITASPVITDNLELTAAIVMTVFGIMSLWPKSERPSRMRVRFDQSGFRRGLILGVLNPLAIPFWIAMTAYLRSQGWIELNSAASLHAYLLGVFAGAFLLLLILGYVSKQAMAAFTQFPAIRRLPGFVLLMLGLYAFVRYFVD